jgi:hypothetical protein
MQLDGQYCAFYSISVIFQLFNDVFTSLAPFFGMELVRALSTQILGNDEQMEEIWTATSSGGFEADTIVSLLKMLGVQVARIKGNLALDVCAYRIARYDVHLLSLP